MTELAGLTAVVTGSSSGIGRAIALEYARAGAAVVVCAGRSRDGADSTAAAVCEIGQPSTVLMADLADPQALAPFVEQAFAWRGSVAVWVNNAGVDTLTGAAGAWPFERKLEALWEVDVRATIILSRMVGQRMRAAGEGVILNVGWDRAERGMDGDSGELFAASKGAVMAFTRSLACSLAPEVRVNCLAPGWVKTAWAETASAYWQQRATSESLLGRWGLPEDVARVARFLASPAASSMTGQVVAINPGR